MTTKAKHQWAATGVSSYPLTHPIVGQGRFFDAFRHFIHLVDDESEKFAHVFAVIAQWGVGKSRLGYELVAQINDTSRGWWVRGDDGSLTKATLFHDDTDRDHYLGLYIRYSQVANDYNNVDNWFAYGLYKALLPLARGTFDDSIQGQIVKEAADRLTVGGFDPKQLAAALECSRLHSDEKLYEDPELATRLCQAAYTYLQTLGIKYVLVVLDELETAAEAATFGLDSTDIKHLDGRAIKLMGKAIKEEDPRRKLPWLRYVALCSPAIGDELREIQSTARRFELAELQSNAFSDVSDFVQTLDDDGRLAESYPQGLVEAAYAMSAGNFGWFNVVMASIDERLRDKRIRGEKDAPSVGALFDELVRVSGRVQEHVLDHHAIDMLKIQDRAQLTIARDLLYGQLPVALDTYTAEHRATVLNALNEYDEPVATLFRRVEWDELASAEALRISKFTRDRGVWRLGGVDQPLDLRQLLSNLGTYAIHETKGLRRTDGKHTLVVPLRQADFVHLVSMLYPHAAAEDAARALWSLFLGNEDLSSDTATHVGPSVEMIARLDLRHRKQGQTSLIFRDPDQNTAHEKALSALRAQPDRQRAQQVLVGAMRVIDQHWAYDASASGIRDEALTVIATSPRSRGASGGGLVAFDGLKLHPKGRALFAWVKNADDLERLCRAVSSQFGVEGRTPLVAFTASRALVDVMANPPSDTLKGAKSYLLLYQLTSTEEHILHQVGVATQASVGFRLDGHGFTTAFSNRLQSLVRPFSDEVGRFRQQLNALGRVAWPLRSSGKLKESEQGLLIRAWRVLAIDTPAPASLANLHEKSGVDVDALKSILAKLGVTPKARATGYVDSERAGLFSRLDDAAEPLFPPFLVHTIQRLLDGDWTFELAEREWFWGYTWEGVKPKDTYFEWMSIIRELGFGKLQPGAKTADAYTAITRAELRSAVQEADNWLKQDYSSLVSDMEAVFGPGRVKELFAPEGAGPGTKTLTARKKLTESVADLDALDRSETQPASVDGFRMAAQRRRRVENNIDWVFRREGYQEIRHDPNVKTLDFESDDVPLWQRIRRSALFVDFVRRAEDRLRQRTRTLADEMRLDVTLLHGFPIALFTLSLEKIAHILDGALAPGSTPCETEVIQANEPGTLRQNLRDLKVAEAKVQLDNLAREVGIDLETWVELPLAQCNGQIVSAFCDLKLAYEKLKSELLGTVSRLHTLESVLVQAPNDFQYPPMAPSLDKLLGRPPLIEGALENARAEDVDRLRSEFDAPARLGNFQPLMSRVRDLLEEPRNSLKQLLGHVLSVENVVTEYRRRLIDDLELIKSQRSIEALSHVQGKAAPTPLGLKALEDAGPLVEAQKIVRSRIHDYSARGSELLGDAGVSFDRWCAIVTALDAGREPHLEPQEADALVKRGLIQRTYRLGVRA